MCRIVENRKHIEVPFSFNNPATASFRFTQSINIDFIPDEMVIRQICSRAITATDTQTYSLSSDLVNGYLCTFFTFSNSTGTIPSGNIKFIINKPVRGIYNFVMTLSQDNTVAIGANSNVSIHMEFIKYKN